MSVEYSAAITWTEVRKADGLQVQWVEEENQVFAYRDKINYGNNNTFQSAAQEDTKAGKREGNRTQVVV